MQVDPTEGQVELIEHAIIANTQLELGPTLQTLMGETAQPRTHLIHLAPQGVANVCRKEVEGAGKRR